MANIHTWALFLLRTALRSVDGPALLSGTCTDPRAHSSETDVMCSFWETVKVQQCPAIQASWVEALIPAGVEMMA